MKNLNIEFPLDKFEDLIISMGWESVNEWYIFWNNQKDLLSINKFWNNTVNEDWIWGLACLFYLRLTNLIKTYQNGILLEFPLSRDRENNFR